MGRNSKSRRDLKRKKNKKSNITSSNSIGKLKLLALTHQLVRHQDNIPKIKKELVTIFHEYDPLDVFLSLSISELWLPNISSQVKHTLAINIFLSIETGFFNKSKEIKTYQQFNNFLSSVYQHLPNIPQLEDYVPEQDWGEIKVLWKDETYKIFYGGVVEQIPDYIKAFELYYSDYQNILGQMENILTLQDLCLSCIDKTIFPSEKYISSGHIEIPSEKFWVECRNMLINSSEIFEKTISKMNKEFIKEFGDIDCIDNSNTLADMVMTGVAIPAIGIKINNCIYPVSFRNMANVVIEHYALINMAADLSYPLSSFISQRFENLFEEPFQLFNRSELLPYKFSGMLEHNNKFYLFASFDVNNPNHLIQLTENVSKLLSTGEWALMTLFSSKLIGIKNTLGKQPTIDDIEFIFVCSHVTTAGGSFTPPNLKYKHHIFFLSEFISLFDSLSDIKELSLFFAYLHQYGKKLNSRFLSIVDKFASFRESHSVLEDGAISFDMISLNPHWGSNWRYDELKKYWSKVPANFPTYNSKWNLGDSYQEYICLISGNNLGISWSTEINGCTIHFYSNCESLLKEDRFNGQLLILFLECMCDALSQRKDILKNISFLDIKKLTIHCLADKEYLANRNYEIKEDISQQLFISISVINQSAYSSDLSVSINLPLIQYRLNKPKDASFEAEICITFLKLLSTILHIQFPLDIEQQIQQTKSRQPRIAISNEERLFDVLEKKTNMPEPKHFKLARKTLANLIKDNGVQEGKYELQKAKEIINLTATGFREKIHATITSMNRNALLLFALENYDAYVNEDHRKNKHLILSLKHEVNYDRTAKLAEHSAEFNRVSGNFRYLLECTLSLDSKSEVIPTTDEILQLLADIDWLIVLYASSDILHNDIDVGGLIIDIFYIPEVFFSKDREIKEKKFSEEQASYKLGYNLNSNDEVEPNILNDRLDKLDKAFLQDLGFNYSSLLTIFPILFQWARFNQIPINLSYQTTKDEMEKVFIQNCKDLLPNEAKKIINFLILHPNQIRKLLGSESEHFDIPVSDHNKRAYRYNIRPLIELNNNKIIWGAAAAYRAGSIWFSHIANGYLPAEFEWSNVSHEVRCLKEYIEKQLELITFGIIKRFVPLLEQGIDFKRRFPKEKFPDVGDFDTLAYFPEKNIWLNIECKYNQPYYCIKDMRRLREKIFGRGEKRGQIGKIEKRIEFLTNNQNKIRSLLNWSESLVNCETKIINLYISRQIYWWLRYPPYETDINFVQVDALEAWLQQHLSLA